jgi:hypothetical protein
MWWPRGVESVPAWVMSLASSMPLAAGAWLAAAAMRGVRGVRTGSWLASICVAQDAESLAVAEAWMLMAVSLTRSLPRAVPAALMAAALAVAAAVTLEMRDGCSLVSRDWSCRVLLACLGRQTTTEHGSIQCSVDAQPGLIHT